MTTDPSSACRIVLVTLLALATLHGCGRFNFSRAPASGPWFSTKLCGIALDNKAKVASLRLQLEILRPLPRGALIETEFRNPVDRSVLAVRRTATGNERMIELVSPPFDQVRPLGYETVTRVYALSDRKKVLGTHKYMCESLVDDRELGPQFR